MDIDVAMNEEIGVWRGIVQAIDDGHSCLSPEVQRLILHLLESGKTLTDDYDFEEIIDSKTGVHDAIMLFFGFAEMREERAKNGK